MARTQSRLERLQAELDEKLQAVRVGYGRRIAACQSRLARMRQELEVYCRAEREQLLPPGRKSLVTAFGRVGFRRAEPSIRIRDGLSEGDVCRLLRQARLSRFVRVKESPDRRAIRRGLEDERLTRDRLQRCGLELVDGEDRFHCDLRQDPLVETGGEA